MSDNRQNGTDGPNLGKDGTIPNSDDGLAVGHDPDGSHFNQEEEEGDDAVLGGSKAGDASGDPYDIDSGFGPDGNPVNDAE